MQLIRDLEATRDETLRYFSLGEAELRHSYGPGKWSVRFILHHLADSETVLFDRIRRVLSEPRQVIWVYDQDAWARGLDYAEVPLDISRRVFRVSPRRHHLLCGPLLPAEGSSRIRAQCDRGAHAEGRVRQSGLP